MAHTRRNQLLALATAVVIGVCVAAGCGGDDESGSAAGGKSVVRFAFSPDPVIDYLKDTGILAELEEKHNVRLNMTSTWDEFAFFAGGHGDIVSMATYEVPILEKETKVKTVTFGKYNALRITPVVAADSTAKTLADLKGKKIGVPSAVSSTLVWGMFAKKLHDLNFRVGEGDFELVVEDHFVMPELVKRGELAACLCIPEAFGPLARKGELKVIYDEKAAWEIFQEEFAPGHKGLMGNNFVARKDWYDSHPKEVAFFLELWDEGMKLWAKDKAEIIASYPQHFAVDQDDEANAEKDVQYFIDYLTAHDWFADSVFLDEDWITQEKKVYDLMKETGFMEQDAEVPEFAVTASG